MGILKQAVKLIAFAATILFLTGAQSRSEKDLTAVITVDTGRELHEINPLVYGHFIEHLGMCIKNGLWTPKYQKHKIVLGGVREDLFNAISDLNMPMLRWPGGCFSDGYHWKDGIGPVEERPVRKNLAWARGDEEETPQGPLEDNTFGTDEFLRLCETLGTEPLINVNLGSGTAEEARQWVEYTNGGADTEYGGLRARNGHPEPYGVKYWGIGNESWGRHEIGHFKTGREYAEKYLEFARAMKSADPNIKLLAVGATPALSSWNKAVLEVAGNEIDFLSLHVYFPGLVIVPRWKGNQKREYYGIMAAGRELDAFLDAFDAQIKKYSPPGADVRTALDEWNLWWNGAQIVRAEDYEFSSALFTADVLIRLLRRGDRVGFANFAQLVNVLGLVITNPGGGMYFTGGYYAFRLFSNLRSDRLVSVEVDSPTFKNHEYGIVTPKKDNPLLEAVALTNKERNRLELVVLNKHYDKEIEAKIEFNDFSAYPPCPIAEINAPSPHSKNTFEEPNIIRETSYIDCSSAGDYYTFPPHSITLLTFGGRK
ncbi:MAG: alpha-L-arabinofuranosidase C-terminal domain-containing protein [bacterium]